MVKACIVKSCGSQALFFDERRTFHSFPSDRDKRKLWMDFVCLVNNDKDGKGTKFSTYSYLCSRHFSDCCFNIVNQGKGRKIKEGHFPTVAIINGIRHVIGTQSCPTIPNTTEPMEVDDDHIQSEIQEQPVENNSVQDSGTQTEDFVSCDSKCKLIELEIKNLKHELVKATVSSISFKEKSNRKQRELKKSQADLRAVQVKLSNRENQIRRYKQSLKDMRMSQRVLRKDLAKTKRGSCPTNEILSELTKREKMKTKGTTTRSFCNVLIQFAIRTYFFGARAYESVREDLGKILPSVRSLQRLLSVIDTRPGFLPSSIEFIRSKCNENKTVYCGLILDEVHIRKEVMPHDGKIIGLIDYGGLYTEPKKNPALQVSKKRKQTTNGEKTGKKKIKKEKGEEATSALFIMVSGINDSWKVPLGYVLTIGASTGLMQAVIKKSIEKLHSIGAHVKTVTFDGLSSNSKAVENLGANLNVDSPDFSPWFPHPISGKKVYVYLDPSHMIKLVRNAFQKFRTFYDQDGKSICWKYFDSLVQIQNEEGLRLANKLTTRHVHFQNQKMKVKFAVQLLSNSVAIAIKVCEMLKIPDFFGSSTTSFFIQIFDRLFDVLNGHAKGMGYKSPLRPTNHDVWKATFERARHCIYNLKIKRGEGFARVLDTDRKTGFRGLLICMKSLEIFMTEIENDECPDLKYLTPYRFSQDHIELFFSILRGRLGFNNNPNVIQLQAALKRILAVSLKPSLKGNCQAQEDEEFDQVSPLSSIRNGSKSREESSHAIGDSVDDFPSLPSPENLSLFSQNIVAYISGFVVRKVLPKCKCITCAASLLNPNKNSGRIDCELLREKNCGGLMIPSDDVINTCRIAESAVRVSHADGLKNININGIIQRAMMDVGKAGLFHDLRNIVSDDHTRFSSHVLDLQRSIISEYVKVRVNHIAKQHNLVINPETIRNRNVKLILFKGQ